MTTDPAPMPEIDYKTELRVLVHTILECGAARDIDAGCEGNGPVALALVALGESNEAANKIIWGDDYDDQ